MRLIFALPRLAEIGGNGGLRYAQGMVAALRDFGHDGRVVQGDQPTFVPGEMPVIDGLLLPHLLPRLDELTALGALAVVHHVSARAGQNHDMRAEIIEVERTMLPRMRQVIATSAAVAERLKQEFGVRNPVVISPGADNLSRSVPASGSTAILAAGVLTPRKGHDVLLQALSALPDLDWTLTIAGSSMQDPAHARQLLALIPELGLTSRAQVVADPDDETLDRLWRGAGLFALATRWEGYPTTVAEALRRGVPVVVTAGGAAGEIVPAGAGVVCALDDMPTLSKCLRRVLFDRALRADMAESAWRAGQALPEWAIQARLFEHALQE